MTKLSNRLELICSLIQKGKPLLDVGSDHALVPIALKERGFEGTIYASEVSKGPFLRMKKAIEESGFDIVPLLGDGLSICPKEVSQVLIAGMGGITIEKILTQGSSDLEHIKYFIVEPQSNVDLVFKKMNELGFKEIKGSYVKEKSKIYPALVYEKGEEVRGEVEMNYSKFALDHSDPILKSHLEEEVTYLDDLLKTVDTDNSSKIKSKLELVKMALTRLNSSYLSK